MSSGRKSIGPYYAKPAPKTMLWCDFLVPAGFAAQRPSPRTDTILSMRDFMAGLLAKLTRAGVAAAEARPPALPHPGRPPLFRTDVTPFSADYSTVSAVSAVPPP